MTAVKRFAITAGEPAGIGPDIVVSLAKQRWPNQLVVIADPALLKTRAKQLGINLTLETFDPAQSPSPSQPGVLTVMPESLAKPVQPGVPDKANAQYVLKTIEQAVSGCQQRLFSGMITAPVHKGIINEAGIAFSGHTEYIAALTTTERVVMCLTTPGLRVALVTTHLPLRNVADAITEDAVLGSLTILHDSLQRQFAIEQPRILVCGLNPHAGEQGHLGREELDIIIPALQYAKTLGINAIGPLPADTLFNPNHLKTADAVLAMYHDQGLPVLKHKGFGNAVNVTLGLPIIRTSVDHGTAFDLAATGQADSGSLHAAIEQASLMS